MSEEGETKMHRFLEIVSDVILPKKLETDRKKGVRFYETLFWYFFLKMIPLHSKKLIDTPSHLMIFFQKVAI